MSKDVAANQSATVPRQASAAVADLRPSPTPAPSQPPQSPPPVLERSAAAELVRVVRRRRAISLARRVVLFVLVPTLLAAVYFGLLASDRFESVSLFTVDSSDTRVASPLESLMGLAGGSTAIRDTLAVRDFVLSREMLLDLEKTEHFISHYKDTRYDWWSRLVGDASFERAFRYYQDVVVVVIDPNSGVLTLRVRAYTAERAESFSKRILYLSEKKVNELAERARQDQIAFATREVEKSEKRLGLAREKFIELQQKHGDFSPEQTAAAAISIRTAIEGEMALARAELAALKSYMAIDAPQVIAANERVRSLAGQAAGETRRLVSPKGDKGVNTSLIEFEKAAVEKEFATQAYQMTLASLEAARTDAIRQHRYLATIARPSTADEAQYPRRWLSTLTAFLASLLLFGIGSLLVASIKEHARL